MFIDKNHSQLLLQGLSVLRQKEQLCDVELRVGANNNTCLYAHKVVLAAVSDYFRAMFTTGMEETFVKTIKLHDVDEKCLSLLLDFAYTGRLCLSLTNVQTLLVTADMLRVSKVVNICCDFLEKQLHPSNCLGFIEFAETHSLAKLKSTSLKYAVNHFIELIDFDEYLRTSLCVLKQVISHDDLNVNAEEDLFSFLEKWVLFNKSSRIEDFYELFNDVRLYQLNTKFLSELKFNSLFTTSAGYTLKLKISYFCNIKLNPYRLFDTELSSAKPRRKSSDYIFLSSGKDGLLNTLNSCVIYNAKNDTYIDCACLPDTRDDTAAVSINEDIYICGGSIRSQSSRIITPSVLRYSHVDNRWISVTEMMIQRSAHVALACAGKLYVIGGYDGISHLKSGECFDPVVGTWSFITEMGYSRSAFSAVTLEEYIYALGGQGTAHLSTVERYDTTSGVWELVPAMSSKRINFGAAQLHGFIFVVGGHNGTNYLRSMERFDPASNEWTVVASMTSPRTGIGVAVVNDEIYVLGGHDGSRYLDGVSKYDPFTNVWRELNKMPTARCYMASTDVFLKSS